VLLDIPGQAPSMQDLPEGCAFAPRCPQAHARCGAGEVPWQGAPEHRYRCWLNATEGLA
jgi:oligopeptide/dipeptide ABC transporter ATP-binding protein